MDREDINRMTGFVRWFLGFLVATLPVVMVLGLIIGNFDRGFFYLLVLCFAVVSTIVASFQPQTQRVPFDQLPVEEQRQVLVVTASSSICTPRSSGTPREGPAYR